jgi:hypothetical protein
MHSSARRSLHGARSATSRMCTSVLCVTAECQQPADCRRLPSSAAACGRDAEFAKRRGDGGPCRAPARLQFSEHDGEVRGALPCSRRHRLWPQRTDFSGEHGLWFRVTPTSLTPRRLATASAAFVRPPSARLTAQSTGAARPFRRRPHWRSRCPRRVLAVAIPGRHSLPESYGIPSARSAQLWWCQIREIALVKHPPRHRLPPRRMPRGGVGARRRQCARDLSLWRQCEGSRRAPRRPSGVAPPCPRGAAGAECIWSPRSAVGRAGRNVTSCHQFLGALVSGRRGAGCRQPIGRSADRPPDRRHPPCCPSRRMASGCL